MYSDIHDEHVHPVPSIVRDLGLGNVLPSPAERTDLIRLLAKHFVVGTFSALASCAQFQTVRMC